MHKADVVGVALADEGGVLIVQPLGRNADGRPLVGGALGVAAQPLHRAVDAQAPVFVVAYGAEAGRQLLGVGLFAVYKQLGLHGVEVGVVKLQKRSGRVSAPACSTVTAMESVAVGAGRLSSSTGR